MLMRRMLWDGIHLSADLGDGGGGGSGELASDASVGGDQGVETAVQTEPEVDAEPFDYGSIEQRYGGREGMLRALEERDKLYNIYQYNPQAREVLNDMLAGKYGAQAQQNAQQQVQVQQQQQRQAPQQQQQQAPMFKYDPGTLSGMQSFYRELQRAQQSGDPELIKAVMDDPANAKAKEAYFAHQQEMNGAWFDQRGYQTKWFNDPEMQQMRQGEMQQFFEQQAQELRNELWMTQKTHFYERNQQAIDGMPQHVKDAFGRGVYGPIRTGQEWIAAAQKAMEEAKRFQVAGNANGAGNGQQQGQPPVNRIPNSRPATNGVKGGAKPQKTQKEIDDEWARKEVEARKKDAAARKT